MWPCLAVSSSVLLLCRTNTSDKILSCFLVFSSLKGSVLSVVSLSAGARDADFSLLRQWHLCLCLFWSSSVPRGLMCSLWISIRRCLETASNSRLAVCLGVWFCSFILFILVVCFLLLVACSECQTGHFAYLGPWTMTTTRSYRVGRVGLLYLLSPHQDKSGARIYAKHCCALCPLGGHVCICCLLMLHVF